MLITERDYQLTIGLHCKACDCPLATADLDPELCGICMRVVTEYNQDLDKPDKYEYEDIDPDNEYILFSDMTLEEFENAILTGEISS